MTWNAEHPRKAHTRFDGGDLDCGNGLLLLIRRHLDPLRPGQLLEVLSTDSSVEEDLPAWSRLTGNELVSRTRHGDQRSYLLCKGRVLGAADAAAPDPVVAPAATSAAPDPDGPLPEVPPLPAFAVMGVGSWPRPRWLLQALHEYLERRLGEADFQQTADDAVRLAIQAQERAGADVITDGEQRRDNYASFVGSRLENCQLVPLTDLLPYVDDPAHFERELRSLDVPAETVRHPAVLGPLRRVRPLTLHELHFARRVTGRPVKVALPGPYLLTRTMWLECVSERVYHRREDLARDLVAVLRAEARALLAAGATLVQFDEPILTEVVYGRSRENRSFMCGALGEKLPTAQELSFARELLAEVCTDLPRERLALHVCRGNWSRDESVALSGDYAPLLPLLRTLPVGVFFLEMCTPRAGELALLKNLPEEARLGLGVVNPKSAQVESVDAIVARAEEAVRLLGPTRVLLNPDCGFATFADSPIAPTDLAEAKLAAIATAARRLRARHGTA